MAGSNGRAKRHFFGGTGLYIALFLGVTALAVAGYWTLLPKNTTDKDAENVSSQVELPVQDETPQMPEAELPQEAATICFSFRLILIYKKFIQKSNIFIIKVCFLKNIVFLCIHIT